MDAQQIKAFIDAMAASDLAEMEASKDGWTLRLVRGPRRAPRVPGARSVSGSVSGSGPQAGAAAAAAESGALLQTAALCGVVFLQPGPGEAPFALPGQPVRAGQTLCVIEAMKVFNEVHAERDGVLDAFLVTSGQDVDAGQPLLRLR